MNNPNVFIGIDPGKSGGVSATTGSISVCGKCPNTPQDMVRLLRTMSELGDRPMCIIEAVHSMPKQGVVSTFTFGTNYGQWLGILSTLGIPYIQVSPQKWMKTYGVMPKVKKDRKNHLKHLAQQRYPDLDVTLATCDAVLLAHYCFVTYRLAH